MNTVDGPAMDVLSNAIGGMMSSRLFQEIRTKLGLAYTVGSGVASYHGVGHFVVAAGLDSGNLQPGIEAIVRELRKILEDGLSEKEFDAAKRNLIGALPIQAENSYSFAVHLGISHFDRGRPQTLKDISDELQAVTREDVLAVARRVIIPSRLHLAMVAPEGVTEDQFSHLPSLLR